MSREEFRKAASQAGVVDISENMQIIGGVRKDIYWQVDPYKLMLMTDFENDKLVQLRLWTAADFNTPRGERYEKGADKSTVRFSPATKKYTSE